MRRALVIVDIQNDYFAGGANPLDGPDAAAAEARRLLDAFRASREAGTGGDRLPRMRRELRRKRITVDDRVAPVIGADAFGEQLHAQTAGLARDRADP